MRKNLRKSEVIIINICCQIINRINKIRFHLTLLAFELACEDNSIVGFDMYL